MCHYKSTLIRLSDLYIFHSVTKPRNHIHNVNSQVVTYLRSLEAVRDRSKQVYNLGVDGKLDHWTFDEAKLADIADYCSKIIEVSPV